MYPLLVKMVCCFVAALKKIFDQFANANRSLNIIIENSVCVFVCLCVRCTEPHRGTHLETNFKRQNVSFGLLF